MILIVLACLGAWSRLGESRTKRAYAALFAGVLVAGMTTFTAASVPILEIPIGPEQELRVMPPTAFPFTIQQHRDYDTNQFYYRIVIGWPDGIQIFRTVATDDQSEFIHWTHFGMMVILGLYMLASVPFIVAGLVHLDPGKGRARIEEEKYDDRRVGFLAGALLLFIVSAFLYFFDLAIPYWTRHIVFITAFWGLYIGLGLFLIALLVPSSRKDESSVAE